MWRIREVRLDGDRMVFAPVGYLRLPREPVFGIAAPSEQCSDGRDATVRSVELFAGAGGLALGTAEAGLCHKVVLEWDDNACLTLRRNHDDGVRHVRDWKIVEGDVALYDFPPYRGKVDVLSGGPQTLKGPAINGGRN
jgi:16S rRNA G966 N2-methylase RsmD